MKFTRFFNVAALTLTATFFLLQCGNNKAVPDVCFTKNIQPIFVTKCGMSGCHSGSGGGHGEKMNFTTYEGIMKKVKANYPLLSEAYTKCTGKNPEMPPKGYTKLSETELQYIKYWIHTGAKNSDCTSACDTLTLSFSGRIKPLLDTWCLGCHSASNAGGGYDFSTYEGVRTAIAPNSRLLGCIEQQTGYSAMPQNGGKLSDCDIIAVKKWIEAGYPNN